MVALTAGREVGMLDMGVVLNLLLQCSNSTIAGYLTRIVIKIHMYADCEVHITTKYSNHNYQVIWEISELVQGESETAPTFFDCVEMLKS